VIDHLVYATPDIDGTVALLADRLGVRATAGGRHPGLGTRNALLDLGGGAYLEIIGLDPEVAVAVDGPRPFGLDRVGAARLATWAARVDGIDERAARARAVGYDPGPVQPMSRRLPDGTELHWRLTAPSAEPVELVPFLIEWTPGLLHPSTTSARGCRLVRFAGEHPDPATVVAALAALGVELALEAGPQAALIAVIEGPAGRLELR